MVEGGEGADAKCLSVGIALLKNDTVPISHSSGQIVGQRQIAHALVPQSCSVKYLEKPNVNVSVNVASLIRAAASVRSRFVLGVLMMRPLRTIHKTQ